MMKKWKRWTAAGLTAMLTISTLTGCKDNPISNLLPSSEPNTSDMMEKYQQEPRFTVWTYSKAKFDFVKIALTNYDSEMTDGRKIEFKTFSPHEYSPEQFSNKLSAEIMSGKGPDLVLCNTALFMGESSEYFKDVEKMTTTGALSSWNEITQTDGWEKLKYYTTLWDAAADADGNVYALPLSVNYYFLQTHPKTMEHFGVTEADFKDANALMAALERVSSQTGEPACLGDPGMDVLFSKVCDYENRKTQLLSEPQYSAAKKWSSLFEPAPADLEHGSTEEAEWHYQGVESFLAQKSLAQVMDSITLQEKLGLTESDSHPDWKVENQLFYPLCDENGDWVGEVTSYAVIPQGSKCKQEVYDFILHYLSINPEYSEGSPSGEYEWNTFTSQRLQPNPQHATSYRDWLKNHPKRIYFGGEGRDYMRSCIDKGIQGTESWEKVAKKLDIYLSE